MNWTLGKTFLCFTASQRSFKPSRFVIELLQGDTMGRVARAHSCRPQMSVCGTKPTVMHRKHIVVVSFSAKSLRCRSNEVNGLRLPTAGFAHTCTLAHTQIRGGRTATRFVLFKPVKHGVIIFLTVPQTEFISSLINHHISNTVQLN